MRLRIPRAARLVADITSSAHEDGIVLLDRLSGTLFAINRSGAGIWGALENRRPETTIAAEIARLHGLRYDSALEHVMQFIALLETHRLVERGEADDI